MSDSQTGAFWPLSIWHTICIIGSIHATWILSKAFYNLFLHPLSNFPGPWYRGAFYWTDLYYWSRGSDHHDMKKLHDKYGGVVRIAPDSLSFVKAQAARDIYTRTGLRRPELAKEPLFYGRPQDLDVPTIIVSDEETHTRYRRQLAHGFSEYALRDQEPHISSHFTLLISRLFDQIRDPEIDGVVDLVRWYNFTTFDIIGDLCFGESFSALQDGEYHPWIGNITSLMKFGWVLRVAYRYRSVTAMIKFLMWTFPSFGEGQKQHDLWARKKAAERIEMETRRKSEEKLTTDRVDVMTYVLKHNSDSTAPMTQEELVVACSSLIIAGSETTAGLLSAATYFLLTNPDAFHAAKSEVRAAFKSNTEIDFSSTQKLPYLLAVIEESLRLYPPVPIGLPRRTPKDGAVIDGQFVPADTQVSFHHYAAYHSSSNFVNADAFAPERWLVSTGSEYSTDDKAALQPFSLGWRNCLGKNLAYAEARSILARMLWNFDMELQPESERWIEHDVRTLWMKGRLMVKLSERK